MRFFFAQELALADAGLDLERILPFGRLTGVPTARDWTVLVVARRR